LSSGEFLLYQTPDGQARIQLRVQDGTVWISQKQLADLYQVSVPAISQHIRSIFEEGELIPEATINDNLIVAAEGARRVERSVAHYRLEMILAHAATARAAKKKKGRSK
jgi:hypothetical protein